MSADEDEHDISDPRPLTQQLIFNREGLPIEEAAHLRVRLANTLHAVGALDDAERLFSISLAIEDLVSARIRQNASPALSALRKQLRDAERAHGLKEGEFFMVSDQPDDIRELNAKWSAGRRALEAATLEEFGCGDLAALYRGNRAKYDELREIGRRKFFEPSGRH